LNIKTFMSQDHKDCDQLFADAENAATSNDWENTSLVFNAYLNAMERHFDVEEQALFPAFEQETGVATGPTEMMRMEHEQMRSLFSEMAEAIQQKNSDDYLGTAETLLVMMQQHNMKEEQILYEIMNQRLSEDANQWHDKFINWDQP